MTKPIIFFCIVLFASGVNCWPKFLEKIKEKVDDTIQEVGTKVGESINAVAEVGKEAGKKLDGAMGTVKKTGETVNGAVTSVVDKTADMTKELKNNVQKLDSQVGESINAVAEVGKEAGKKLDGAMGTVKKTGKTVNGAVTSVVDKTADMTKELNNQVQKLDLKVGESINAVAEVGKEAGKKLDGAMGTVKKTGETVNGLVTSVVNKTADMTKELNNQVQKLDLKTHVQNLEALIENQAANTAASFSRTELVKKLDSAGQTVQQFGEEAQRNMANLFKSPSVHQAKYETAMADLETVKVQAKGIDITECDELINSVSREAQTMIRKMSSCISDEVTRWTTSSMGNINATGNLAINIIASLEKGLTCAVGSSASIKKCTTEAVSDTGSEILFGLAKLGVQIGMVQLSVLRFVPAIAGCVQGTAYDSYYLAALPMIDQTKICIENKAKEKNGN